MKTKKIYVGLMTLFALLMSCEKSELMSSKELNLTKDVKTQQVFDLMLNASTVPIVVESMNNEAITSCNVGLDESIFLEELINNDDTVLKSGSNSSNLVREFILDNINTTRSGKDITLYVSGVEIYWPYCENWDGYSQPVIVINEYNDNQFIEKDKVYAYKAVDNGVEKLIVDEEYAKNNPVWVINESDVELEDVLHRKARANNNTLSQRSDVLCELVATTITSTVQHDTWINGGSEYVIYWAHEDFGMTNNIRVNISEQIKLSRNEISNATPKQFNFICNFDWSIEQKYNRFMIIEFDPGADKQTPMTLTANVNGVDVTLETTVITNETDEKIMNYHVPRQSMFTSDTYIDDMHYQKTFSGSGVTLQTTLNCSNKINGI